ncbi:MAG TPA: APC family permease [Streptosporangiaceae bacterium]|nr:APC family permease [Streptosporangiaceae bacterium]
MAATPSQGPGLKRTLSVWQAVGLSMALMAPSMAANINPQGAIGAGRAVPLAFLIAAFGVLLVAYTFVRLCQYFKHSGSVYAFVGATLGPRAGVVAGWGLVGTYTFYAVTTAAAAGIFGTGLLDSLGIWKNQPAWSPMLLVGVVLVLALLLAAVPARRGTNILLTVELSTVALILIVTAVVFVRLISHNAPGGEHFTMSVFSLQHGIGISALFLGVVFGFLSFAGFEAASTLGEEARNPHKDIPRAILGVALFGGIYFVIVTAAEMMGFGTNAAGITKFGTTPSLLGFLGTSYVGSWVGNIITLGTTVSAFGCCLACTVGASRLIYAMTRDSYGARGPGKVSRWGTPTHATGVVTAMAVAIYVMILAVSHHASAMATNAFLWCGAIGTLILLVAYVLATVGMVLLVFVRRKMPSVPMWQIVVPIAAVIVLGYTLYRNVWPYPTGDQHYFPIVAGAWLAAAIIAVIAAPRTARRLGQALTAQDIGGVLPEPVTEPGLTVAGDEATTS